VLNAERLDRHFARMRLDDEVHPEHAVLPATADDVASLNEDLVIGVIFNGQLVHVTGLEYAGLLAVERLLKGLKPLAAQRVRAAYDEHRKVAMRIRSTDGWSVPARQWSCQRLGGQQSRRQKHRSDSSVHKDSPWVSREPRHRQRLSK